jgi:hypothetical protein
VQRCDGDAQAVHVMEGTVLTGFHESCQGDLTQRLVANDAVDGSRDFEFQPTFDRYWGIRALDGTGDRLVVAGDFTSVQGVALSGVAIFATRPAPEQPVRLGGGATWRYHDGATPVAPGWQLPEFDDSAWPAGRAELGYGDGDEATVLATGAMPSPRPITSYYRTTFEAAAVPDTLTLRLLADDGAVVYLNGEEVLRENLPDGPISPTTRTVTGRSGDSENAVSTYGLPPSAVQVGSNVLAVEVHQDSSSSSDASFLAALSSTGAMPEETTTTTTTTTVPEETTTTTTTSTTVPEETTTTTTTSTTVPEETTTTTTTSTTVPEETTTTSSTTTTTVPVPPPDDPPEPPPAEPIYVDSFSGDDGSPWPGWLSTAQHGAVDLVGGEGRLVIDDATGAFARAILTAPEPRADGELRFSYRWAPTGASASFSIFLRGGNGWRNAYRPRDGYGIEFASNSRHVVIRRAVNGVTSTILPVPGGQEVTTERQHVRLRVVGDTISFKVWVDGTPEPEAWHSVTDGAVTEPGRVYVSLARNGTNVGERAVLLDDLVYTDGG